MALQIDGKDWREPVYYLTKVNFKTYTHLTGAQIAALTNVPLGKIYFCTTTGSGFTAGNNYMRNENDTAWIVVYGPYDEVISSALRNSIIFNEPYPRKVLFRQFTSTGGTITDDNTSGGIMLETNGTDTGRCSIMLEGNCCPIDFAKPAILKFKMELPDAERLLARIGCGFLGMNTVTMDATKHFGMEIDNPASNDTFWSLSTGDGTTRSTLLTSNYPVGATNTFRYIVEYIGGSVLNLYVNGSLISSKTNNLPNTGALSGYNFIAGVRTKHADNKPLNLRSLVLLAHNWDFN